MWKANQSHWIKSLNPLAISLLTLSSLSQSLRLHFTLQLPNQANDKKNRTINNKKSMKPSFNKSGTLITMFRWFSTPGQTKSTLELRVHSRRGGRLVQATLCRAVLRLVKGVRGLSSCSKSANSGSKAANTFYSRTKSSRSWRPRGFSRFSRGLSSSININGVVMKHSSFSFWYWRVFSFSH